MAKRISYKRALELYEKGIEEEPYRKAEKHVRAKAKIKVFLSNLKLRYLQGGRTDLADKVEVEDYELTPERVKDIIVEDEKHEQTKAPPQ